MLRLNKQQKTVATSRGLFHHNPEPVERWLSGLRRTPGKRDYSKGNVGSNPSLSATSPSTRGVFIQLRPPQHSPPKLTPVLLTLHRVIRLRFRELRTAEALPKIAKDSLGTCRRLTPGRLLLAQASAQDFAGVEAGLASEESAEREAHRQCGLLLREELEALRHSR